MADYIISLLSVLIQLATDISVYLCLVCLEACCVNLETFWSDLFNIIGSSRWTSLVARLLCSEFAFCKVDTFLTSLIYGSLPATVPLCIALHLISLCISLPSTSLESSWLGISFRFKCWQAAKSALSVLPQVPFQYEAVVVGSLTCYSHCDTNLRSWTWLPSLESMRRDETRWDQCGGIYKMLLEQMKKWGALPEVVLVLSYSKGAQLNYLRTTN